MYGAWTEPAEERFFDSVNPANGKTIARVTQANASEVDAAIAAARRAFEGWSRLPGHARARYLYALARQIQKHSRWLGSRRRAIRAVGW